MKKITLAVLLLLTILIQCNIQNPDSYLQISKEEYQQKVYASWIGQIIGNIYGLVHENKYIDEPGPEDFPYGYDYEVLPFGGIPATQFLKEQGGAFSDDDTDIEYMYLIQMEKHGIEPTYAQLAEAWKYHIRSWVWVANRAALRMMNYGYFPPYTGDKKNNPYWFEIDPQLVNEIWAVTAPGMIDYACEKSEWSARITSDDWGLEPTIFYAAMYSAAFFEKDISTLINIGKKALGENSYFAKIITEMQTLYHHYPSDWKAARAELSKQYWHGSPDEFKSVYNSVLNGACSVLALLYGQGDFHKTLDLSCAIGWDADNQAASMCGLLGIINGIDGIPEELLLPIKGWTKPFNDQYINRSRYDLPNTSITGMSERTAKIGEKIILAKDGKIIEQNGIPYYQINKKAKFQQKLELHSAPLILFHQNEPSEYALNCSYNNNEVKWKVNKSDLPQDIKFENGTIKGIPSETGTFEIEVTAQLKKEAYSQSYTIYVLGQNQAPSAQKILLGTPSKSIGSISEYNKGAPSDNKELLRNGITSSEYYSSYNPKSNKSFNDYYGYQWENKIEISEIIYYTGFMEQHGGWFTTFNVEYLDANNNWQSVSELKVSPKQQLNNQTFAQSHFSPYLCRFDPIKTKAIRIIGQPAGKVSWNHKNIVHFITLSELEVY